MGDADAGVFYGEEQPPGCYRHAQYYLLLMVVAFFVLEGLSWGGEFACIVEYERQGADGGLQVCM